MIGRPSYHGFQPPTPSPFSTRAFQPATPIGPARCAQITRSCFYAAKAAAAAPRSPRARRLSAYRTTSSMTPFREGLSDRIHSHPAANRQAAPGFQLPAARCDTLSMLHPGLKQINA
jgi:hypothetical protein